MFRLLAEPGRRNVVRVAAVHAGAVSWIGRAGNIVLGV